MAKEVLLFTRRDIQDAAGSMQLCAGQISRAKAVIHALRKLLDYEKTEVILPMNASNALNSLNKQIALQDIRKLCPSHKHLQGPHRAFH